MLDHKLPSPLCRLAVGMLVVLSAAAASGCRKDEPKPAPVVEQKPAALESAQPAPPSPPPPAEADRSKPNVFARESDFLKPGWSKLSLQDTMPICAFSSAAEREKAQFMRDANKKQTLRANEKVVFGVYGPWCLHDGCDVRPNLQCWTTLEGDTLTVHSRYFSFHNDAQNCSKDCLGQDSSCETNECRGLDTACVTPELPPGKYTIRHGAETYSLKIPSVLRDPCFGQKH